MTDAQERFLRACELSDDRWWSMSPGERDRIMQVHLAAARGPHNNFILACEMSDFVWAASRAREPLEAGR
jgi:hypothetical protein